MYLTTGDGASFSVVDDLALRAQSLTSLAGKVLHITRTGAGISTNPFWTGNASNVQSKIWARGLRNPFRMSLQPGTNQVFLGDVGWSAFEEINVAVRGANLGWPCYEGLGHQGGYESKPTCQTLYAAGPTAVRMPLTSYAHDNLSAAVVGGPFYTGTAYPPLYRGAYFFGDYARGWIQFLNVDASNNLVSGPTTFGSDLPGPVDIQMLGDEQLYYIAINTGELRRIRYVGASETRYASDINWLSAVNGWGPVERDRSNGETAAGDGRTLTIGGVTYVKGLGVHAYSEIRYQLDGICTALDAVVGVDDEVGANGSVVFNIFGDGTQIYTSGVLTGSSNGVPVSLSLHGIRELALIVTDGGNGSGIRSRRLGGPEADLRWLRRQPVCAAGEHARAGQHTWRDSRGLERRRPARSRRRPMPGATPRACGSATATERSGHASTSRPGRRRRASLSAMSIATAGSISSAPTRMARASPC